MPEASFALAIASRSVIGIYRPILEPLGLTHPQYLVMLALWEFAPLRFGEIAETLSLDPAPLSPLIKGLEQAKLVERMPVEGDERTFNLVPTAEGTALREQALSVPPAGIQRLGLPVDQLMALRDDPAVIINAVNDHSADSEGAEPLTNS